MDKQIWPVSKSASRPIVVAHFAMTADGKTSARTFSPAIFTSPADKRRVQEVRADAVIAGRGTLATDSVTMGLSHQDLRKGRADRGLSPVPLRVIVSNAGTLDPGWKVFKYSGSPLIVFSTRRMPARLRTEIAQKSELFLFQGRTVDLRKSLEILRSEFGVKRIVCEGGGALLRSLASLDLIDEISLTVAPVVFGGHLVPTLTGLPGRLLIPPLELEIVRQSLHADQCFLELRRKKNAA